jgi:hypothetical protein
LAAAADAGGNKLGREVQFRSGAEELLRIVNNGGGPRGKKLERHLAEMRLTCPGEFGVVSPRERGAAIEDFDFVLCFSPGFSSQYSYSHF